MSRRRLLADFNDVYTEAERKQKGLILGDHIDTSIGRFLFTETSGDLTKGMILIGVDRYSQTDLTIVGTPTALPKSLAVDNAGAIVAVNDWAGKWMYFSNDENIDNAILVESNEAGINGAQEMIVKLVTALTGVIGTNPDIIIIDRHYVVKSTVSGGDLLPVIGVCPVTVDQSVAPFFWRQVSGDAPVLIGGGIVAVGRKLSSGDDTAGSAAEQTEQNADDTVYFGSVWTANTAADKIGMVRLNGILS